MDNAEWQKRAQEAIDRAELNPFSIMLALCPVVQVGSPHPVLSFPVKSKYVGYQNGRYVYNLDARQILKHIERHKLEFDI
jgi:hypothetical protein